MRPGQRLMAPGYAELLRFLINMNGTATWRAVAARFDVNRSTAPALLRACSRHGLAHITQWIREPVDKRTSLMPAYAFGPGVDAPHPGFKDGSAFKGNKPDRVRIEFMTFANAVKALQEEPLHGRALAEHVGCSYSTARKIIAALRKAKLAHIASYLERADRGRGAPLYAFGIDCKDARKPRPVPLRTLWEAHNRLRSERRKQAVALGLVDAKRARPTFSLVPSSRPSASGAGLSSLDRKVA